MKKTTSSSISRIIALLTVSIITMFVETLAYAEGIKFTTQTNIVGIRGHEAGTLWQSAELVLTTRNKKWSFGNDHDWNLERNGWSNESTVRYYSENVSGKVAYVSGSNTEGYAGAGICLSNAFGKNFGFIETTIYFPRDTENEEEYLDFFGGISHKLDNTFSVGFQGYWDLWTDTGDKLMQIGPVVSVQIDNICFSTRISKNWYDPTIGDSKQSGEIRFEASIAM